MTINPDSKISEEAWSEHRAFIFNLYVVGRMSLGAVRQMLQDQYAFSASIDQYKRKLKNWGFHKNLKASTCRAIGHALKSRRLASTDASTLIQGIAVSPDRLTRALRRHDLPTLRHKMGLEQQPRTPDEVIFRRELLCPSALSSRRFPGVSFLSEAISPQALSSFSPRSRYPDNLEIPLNTEFIVGEVDSVLLNRISELSATLAKECIAFLPVQEPYGTLQDFNALIPDTGKVDHFILITYAIYLCANNHISETRFDDLADYLLEIGDKNFLKYLLRMESICMRSFEDQLLFYAARKNRIDLLDLLDHRCIGVGRSNEWNTSLMRDILFRAIWYKSETFCLRLMEHGDNPVPGVGFKSEAALDMRVLETAAVRVPSIFPYILSRTSATEGRVALPLAVKARLSFVAILSLLNEGVDVNAVDSECRTALHYAIQAEDEELVMKLLEWNATTEAVHHLECKLNPDYDEGEGWSAYSSFEDHWFEDDDECIRCRACPSISVAAMHDDTHIVELLLEAGADVNATVYEPRCCRQHLGLVDCASNSSETFGASWFANTMQIAALDGSIDLLGLLYEHGAAITTLQDLPLLVLAGLQGHREVVEFLLERGADIHEYIKLYRFSCDALQAASYNGDLSLVTHLVEAGASIDAPARGSCGRTALQHAAENEHIDVVLYLLEHGADVNAPPAASGGLTALQAAVLSQDQDLVRDLLSWGANVIGTSTADNAVTKAIEIGSKSIFWLLYNAGADLSPWSLMVDIDFRSNSGRSLAEEALYRSGSMSLELLRLILNNTRSFRLDAGVYGTLVRRWDCNDLVFLQFLRDQGLSIDPPKDSRHETFLEKACRLRQTQAVQLILQNGADVNLVGGSYNGRTALAHASGHGDLLLVQLLLQSGANVNIIHKTFKGRTALQAASESGCPEVVEILIQYGADVNSPPSKDYGMTALQAAVCCGHLKIAQMLVAEGADVAAPGCIQMIGDGSDCDEMFDIDPDRYRHGGSNGRGIPALYAAAILGHLDIVQHLLDHYQLRQDESLSVICDTAAKFAKRNKNWVVVELLKTYQRGPNFS